MFFPLGPKGDPGISGTPGAPGLPGPKGSVGGMGLPGMLVLERASAFQHMRVPAELYSPHSGHNPGSYAFGWHHGHCLKKKKKKLQFNNIKHGLYTINF